MNPGIPIENLFLAGAASVFGALCGLALIAIISLPIVKIYGKFYPRIKTPRPTIQKIGLATEGYQPESTGKPEGLHPPKGGSNVIQEKNTPQKSGVPTL